MKRWTVYVEFFTNQVFKKKNEWIPQKYTHKILPQILNQQPGILFSCVWAKLMGVVDIEHISLSCKTKPRYWSDIDWKLIPPFCFLFHTAEIGLNLSGQDNRTWEGATCPRVGDIQCTTHEWVAILNNRMCHGRNGRNACQKWVKLQQRCCAIMLLHSKV